MRFNPWLLSFVFGTALMASAASVLAEQTNADSEQHQALDDAALEEKYGIKAGSVQRDEQPSSADNSDADAANGTDTESTSTNAESENTEGGTGGTGSAEDAIESGEDEQSNDDNE